jgi:hypothetical protein
MTFYTTNDSTHLNKFVNKKFPYSVPRLRFSNKSKSLLEQLLKTIAFGSIEYKKTSIKSQWIPIGNDDVFPRGYNYNYCKDNIKREIENMNKICCIYTIKIKDREFQVSFIAPNNLPNIENHFNKSITLVYIWLYLACKFAPNKCSHKINIYLYLTPLKKYLPTSGYYIDENHANTAFTTSCKTITEINIFRQEEWFKVLIHETFHCMGLDFSEFDQTKIDKHVLSIFPVNSDVRLFETYCEMWAEIINNLIISFVSYKNYDDIENITIEHTNKMIKNCEKLLMIEQTFSVFQCAKVLKFFDLEYTDLYELHCKYKRDSNYKEGTHVLSYYILKCIYMFHVNEFIEWCSDYNKNGVINFNKQPHLVENNMYEYFLFIREHYKNPEFINAVNGMLSWFHKTQKKLSKSLRNADKFELKTLRMSIHEII